MKDVLTPIAIAFGDALEPLLEAFTDVDSFLALADELGYELDTDEVLDDFLDPDGAFGDFALLAADIRVTIEAGVDLANQLRMDPTAVDLVEIVDLVNGFRGLVVQVGDLRAPSAGIALPPLLDIDELWDTLSEELPEFLLSEYLAAHQPLIYGALEILGIARRVEIVPEEGLLRQPYVRRDIRWDYLADLLSDPSAHVREVFRWNGASKAGDSDTGFDHERLLAAATNFAAAVRLNLDRRPMSDQIYLEHYPEPHLAPSARPNELAVDVARGREANGLAVQLGFIIAPVPEPGENSPEGILISNVTEGSVAATVTLVDGWTFSAGGSASASHALSLSILPSGVTGHSELPSLPDVSMALTGASTSPAGVWTLAGSTEGTGVTLGGVGIELGLGEENGVPDIKATLSLSELQLLIGAGEADNLINSLLESIDIAVSVSLELGYSTQNGISFAATGGTLGGPDGISFEFPTDINLGPFTISDLTLSLKPVEAGMALAATTSLLAELRPFSALVSNLGVAIELVEAADGNGQIGPFDLAVKFRPPSRLAFAIESEAITGGGFLEITETRYAGALMVQVISVGIAAITVIDTELPDDPEGWSFFAALSLEFPAIPLGFGFTLTGLGGLVALHREFDGEALAIGLKSGAVDSLLFPDDPINDAAAIIAQIDDYFPPMQGNTVIGPMVQIGWGVPKTLLTAEIGVIISLPQGAIGLLGSIAVELPDPAAPLLSLRLDILGYVSVPDGIMSITASLYDSTLLGVIELSGDMGTFLSVIGQPYFLLSVGGYNPGFQPPALVPPSLQQLRRMQASISIGETVDIRITNYFALTSNTVQFGSEVVLEASVKIWPTTYTARGELGFHIFLRFSPFLISADFEASVGVYAGDKELMGVHLAAHLEGPDPWFASGFASFRFFGKDVEFAFDVGSQIGSESKPSVPLRDEVVLALADAANWQEVAPIDQLPGEITYIDEEEIEGEQPMWVRPDHHVEVRQGVAPLNRTIEKVGQGLPSAGHEVISITDAGLVGASSGYEIAADWFAPAQFENIGKKEKLSRASYETMDAGVRLAGSELESTVSPDELGRVVEIDYEESLYDPEDGALQFSYPPGALREAARTSGVGQALRHQKPARQGGEFTIEDTRWTLVDDMTGLEATSALAAAGISPGGTSQAEVMAVLAGNGSEMRAAPATILVAAA